MKKQVKILTVACSVILAFSSVGVASAAVGESWKRKLQKVVIQHDGVLNKSYIKLYPEQDKIWNNPDGEGKCADSSFMVIADDHPLRKDLYAAALGAKLTQQDVSARLDGCVEINGTTYPKVINFRLE